MISDDYDLCGGATCTGAVILNTYYEDDLVTYDDIDAVAMVSPFYLKSLGANQYHNITWSYPINITINAPNNTGTFGSIKCFVTLYNGSATTAKTGDAYLMRSQTGGVGTWTTIATYSDDIPALSAHCYEYTETTDYRNYYYKLEVTSNTGWEVNQTAAPDFSYLYLGVATYVQTDTSLVYGIYEETPMAMSDLTTLKIDGTDRKAALITQMGHNFEDDDQQNVSLKSYLTAPIAGNWHSVQINPNGKCRIQSDLFIKMFVKATTPY
jgi:hypothetical protein